jgi:hypothetical protein
MEDEGRRESRRIRVPKASSFILGGRTFEGMEVSGEGQEDVCLRTTTTDTFPPFSINPQPSFGCGRGPHW